MTGKFLKTDDVLVIYHGACLDGFTSAWVAWRYLVSQGVDAEFHPAIFGGELPDVADKIVYMLDFSASRAAIADIHRLAKRFVILDHHKSAEAELEGLPYAHFNMKKSGAGMTWDYFFPDDSRPWLVDYVEDRDLWKFRMPNSRPINAWVSTAKQTFEDWDTLCAEGPKKALAHGQAVELFIERYIREMRSQVQYMPFAGHDDIPVVNAPYINISELVGSMAEDVPDAFAVGWFQRGDGQIQYSLRSRGKFDVSELAQRFGGGGHAQSAGFTTVDRIH